MNNLSKIRESKGSSQNQLAKMIDTPQSTVSNYESSREMKEDFIKKVCKVLDCSADYLLGLIDEEKE